MRIFSNKKAQSVVIEQMLIFAIGIGFFSMTVLLFGSMKNDVEERVTTEKVYDIGEYVCSSIVELYAQGETITGANTILLKVPEKIGENAYTIELKEGNVTIITEGYANQQISLPVYNINSSINLSGSALSSSNPKLTYTKEKIRLE